MRRMKCSVQYDACVLLLLMHLWDSRWRWHSWLQRWEILTSHEVKGEMCMNHTPAFSDEQINHIVEWTQEWILANTTFIGKWTTTASVCDLMVSVCCSCCHFVLSAVLFFLIHYRVNCAISASLPFPEHLIIINIRIFAHERIGGIYGLQLMTVVSWKQLLSDSVHVKGTIHLLENKLFSHTRTKFMLAPFEHNCWILKFKESSGVSKSNWEGRHSQSAS